MKPTYPLLTVLIIIGSGLSVGCASMTKAKIDKAGVGQARSVAIVGFHVSMEEPKSLAGDFAKLKDLTKGKVRDANEEHDSADEIYAELSKRLSQQMNWSMMPPHKLGQNTAYKALVQKYTKGFQLQQMQGENYHKIRPHSVLDADPFILKIEQAERDALMTELGVDAVVVDFTLVGLKNESMFGGMVGAAKYRPKAQNIIRLFIKGRKDPVWFDTWAWGEADKALQASLNFVEDKPLLEQVVLASKKSFDETMTRYKSH